MKVQQNQNDPAGFSRVNSEAASHDTRPVFRTPAWTRKRLGIISTSSRHHDETGGPDVVDHRVCFGVQGGPFGSASPDDGTMSGRGSAYQVVGGEDFLEDALHLVDVEGPEGLGAEVAENPRLKAREAADSSSGASMM